MNDPGINQQPDTVDPAGANPECVTAEGIFDMHGNLHEWIADPDGTFKGGFYADGSINGPGCTYATTAHAFDYHDYSTGFRCCADPAY
jgi:sulfatase modifying factor 1